MSKELDCSFNIQTTDILLSHFLNNQTSADDTVWIQVNVFVNEVTRISLFLFLARFFLDTTLCWLLSLIIPLKWYFFCLFVTMFVLLLLLLHKPKFQVTWLLHSNVFLVFIFRNSTSVLCVVGTMCHCFYYCCVCVWVLVLSHIVFFTPYINCYVFDLFNIFIRIMFIFFL